MYTINIDQSDWEKTPETVKNALLESLNYASALLAKGSFFEEAGFKAQLSKIASHRNKVCSQVVFVSDHISPRQMKLGYGLIQNGWEVVLLHKNELPKSHIPYYSRSFSYTSPQQAVILAALFSPTAYHLFSSWDFETAEAILRHKLGSTVFDTYDLLLKQVKPDLKERLGSVLASEEFCLENADGVCTRSLQLQHTRKVLGRRLTKKVIFFPEYCWGGVFDSSLRRPLESEELHFVFVGSCSPEYFHAKKEIAGTTSRSFVDLLTSFKMHYHIYPFHVSGTPLHEAFPDYFELSRTNEYFHFHEPVSPADLISEISQYHVGIFVNSYQTMMEGDKAYVSEYFNIYTANKLFDYLDAGLAIVVGAGKLVNWLTTRLGTGRICYYDDLERFLSSSEQLKVLMKNRENNKKAVATYSVVKQCRRLARFYGSISK